MATWSLLDLLPGLYVALLVLALARVLKRWYDPVPGICWGAYVSVLLLFLGPVLFGGKILLPLDNQRGFPPFLDLPPTEPHGNLLQGDLIQLIAPSVEQVRTRVLNGRWPLWNPLAGAGMPLLADPQAQSFQPLVLLAYPFDVFRGAAVTAACRLLTALVFTCLVLRRRGLGVGPSLAGSLAYGLGGFVTLWLGWPLANTAVLFPVVLYALERCAHGGRLRDRLLLAAAVAAFLLSGHPETVVFGSLYLLVRFLGIARNLHARRAAWLWRTAGAALIGAALTAPILLPTARYLPETVRAETMRSLSEEAPQARGVGPRKSRLAERWLPNIAPNALGNSRYAHYWGPRNTNEDASGFSATTTLLLAMLALGLRRRRRFEGETVALVTAAAVLVVLSLPMGWLAEALASLPLLGAVVAHGGTRSLFLLSFSLSILAAGTLERLSVAPPPRPLLAGLALGLGGIFVWAYLRFPQPQDAEVLDVLRWGWLHWQLRFLVLASLSLALWPRRRWLSFGLAFLIAAELTLAHRSANPAMPRGLVLPQPPPLQALVESVGPGRILALGDTLPPNLAWLYGLADLRIYNPMAPVAYARLLSPLSKHPLEQIPSIEEADHPLLDLLGVEWVLAPPGLEVPPTLQLIRDDPSGRLFRRRNPLGRFFLPAAVEVTLGRDWLEPVARNQDFGQLALIHQDSALAKPWKAHGVERAEVVESMEPARASPWFRAHVVLGESRLLASSLYQHGREAQASGGWRLLVDGRLSPSIRANGPLLAAWLPAGEHGLDLLYRPPGFLLGCLLAALAIAAAAILWWPSPRHRIEFPP